MAKNLSLFLLGVIISSLGIRAQEMQPSSRFANWFVNDPISAVKDFRSSQLISLGVAGFSVGTLTNVDVPNSMYMHQKFKDSEYLNVVNEFGTFRIVAPASAALFGVSLLSPNQKFQDAAFTSFQAVMNTAVTVNFAKFMFARSRPYQNDGAFDFDYFEKGETSFPSGHASTAFALITPWVMYYPKPLTFSLYIIPVSTSMARIVKGKHWLSDVTAGALIGTYWGYYLSKKHKSLNNPNLEITSMFQNGGGGVNIKVKL